ncbi:MAG: lysine transporter LysE [Planctomycetes bacterium]|nr:lysine transporter LysE [Planctomycetota bacterium]
MKSRWAIFGSAFVIGLSGAMMPGPLLTACIGYTMERGFLAGGPLLVLGHALLELALVVLVLAGLGPLLARPRVGAAIGLVGGAVLVWMGYGMIASAASHRLTMPPALQSSSSSSSSSSSNPLAPGRPQRVEDDDEDEDEHDKTRLRRGWLSNPVLAGILISLANPYWSLWWATIGLKYIALSRESGRAGVGAFYCGHQLSDVGWYFFVAAAVALGRRAVPDAAYRWIIGVCGGVLLAFAAYFIIGAIRTLVKENRNAPGHVPQGG